MTRWMACSLQRLRSHPFKIQCENRSGWRYKDRTCDPRDGLTARRGFCYDYSMNDRLSSQHNYRALYQRAFDDFGTIALWNKTRLAEPSPEHALVIAKALRTEGNRLARALAEEIETAARAAI